jgi:glycosyltransferase involved in cell wall biosynthesis
MRPGVGICLVTPSHLASAPRVVKEADALTEAGFQVTVISARNSAAADPLDEAIRRQVRWQSRRVDLRGRGRLGRSLLHRAARMILAGPGIPPLRLAAWAESSAFPALWGETRSCPARLYIGHCLTGLAAILPVARAHGAHAGFDAEDYHEAELEPEKMGTAGIRAARILQKAAWKQCEHLTAAAPLIAQQLREDYGRMPGVILNVFPKRMAPDVPPRERPKRSRVRLYWFSQTIGPGRGLEQLVEACRFLERPVEVRMRGHEEEGFARRLEEKLAVTGRGHVLQVAGLAPPDEMARLAAECDIGLCLEQNEPANRGLCLTNKIFTYLLAGVPMVLSDTPAHRELAPRLGPAALVADLENPKALAEAISRLAVDAAHGRQAAEHAWRLGQERYNWEVEKKNLVERVQRVLNPGGL